MENSKKQNKKSLTKMKKQTKKTYPKNIADMLSEPIVPRYYI